MGSWALGLLGTEMLFQCGLCAEGGEGLQRFSERIYETGNRAEVGAPELTVASDCTGKRAQVVPVRAPCFANGRRLVIGPGLAAVGIAQIQEEGGKPER